MIDFKFLTKLICLRMFSENLWEAFNKKYVNSVIQTLQKLFDIIN